MGRAGGSEDMTSKRDIQLTRGRCEAHRVERVELAVHSREAVRREAVHFGDDLHLIEVAYLRASGEGRRQGYVSAADDARQAPRCAPPTSAVKEPERSTAGGARNGVPRTAPTTWYLPVRSRAAVVLRPSPEDVPVMTTSFLSPNFSSAAIFCIWP